MFLPVGLTSGTLHVRHRLVSLRRAFLFTGIMDMMKDMYDEGDDNTKKIIGGYMRYHVFPLSFPTYIRGGGLRIGVQ